MTQTAYWSALLAAITRKLRDEMGWSQEELADEANIDRRTLQNIESGQGNPTLSKLVSLSQALGVDLPLLFAEIEKETTIGEDHDGNVLIEVSSDQADVDSVFISIDNLSNELYNDIVENIKVKINTEKGKKSDRVAQAFFEATKMAPQCNPSDLWHHVIYRTLRYGMGWSAQSWKRTSGWALETALCMVFEDKLKPYNIRLSKKTKNEANKILASTELNKLAGVGDTKIDLFIEGFDSGIWHPFGIAHVKASIAERVVDDIPASKAVIEAGWISVLMTMDMKSYPPPHGNGINYGELGGRNKAGTGSNSIKRGYVEEDGSFSALFSFNERTPPSDEITNSGNKIYTLGFWEEQPDNFVDFIKREWDRILDSINHFNNDT